MENNFLLKRKRQSYSFILRSLSLLLVFCFLFQELLYAYPDIQKIEWTKKPEKDLTWARSVLPAVSESTAHLEDARKGNSGRTIILVQDAHTNNSCQLNTARLLEDLISGQNNKSKTGLVFTEAAVKDVSLSALRAHGTPEDRKRIAAAYLNRGLLHGSEYLDLVSDLRFELWGVEDAELYKQSVRAYADVLKERPRFSDYLYRIDAAVKILKPRIYNAFLRAFDEQAALYHAEKLSLTDYFEALKTQSRALDLPIGDYPALKQLESIQQSESAIDFARANTEMENAVQSLSADDKAELISGQKALKLNSEDRARIGFFLNLKEKLVKGGAFYGELQKYFTYLEKVNALDHAAVLKELGDLEEAVYKRLINNDEERALFKTSAAMALLRKLLNLTLTPDEYARYKAAKEDFSIQTLTGFVNKKLMELHTDYDKAAFIEEGYEPLIERCEAFYELTYERDKQFVKNALEKLQSSGQNEAILITGGYHTPNLKYLLKNQDISYISVVPQIQHETDQARYESILLSQFSEYKNILKPAVAFKSAAGFNMTGYVMGREIPAPYGAAELVKDIQALPQQAQGARLTRGNRNISYPKQIHIPGDYVRRAFFEFVPETHAKLRWTKYMFFFYYACFLGLPIILGAFDPRTYPMHLYISNAVYSKFFAFLDLMKLTEREIRPKNIRLLLKAYLAGPNPDSRLSDHDWMRIRFFLENKKITPKAAEVTEDGGLRIYFYEPDLRRWLAPIFHPLAVYIMALESWTPVQQRFKEKINDLSGLFRVGLPGLPKPAYDPAPKYNDQSGARLSAKTIFYAKEARKMDYWYGPIREEDQDILVRMGEHPASYIRLQPFLFSINTPTVRVVKAAEWSTHASLFTHYIITAEVYDYTGGYWWFNREKTHEYSVIYEANISKGDEIAVVFRNDGPEPEKPLDMGSLEKKLKAESSSLFRADQAPKAFEEFLRILDEKAAQFPSGARLAENGPDFSGRHETISRRTFLKLAGISTLPSFVRAARAQEFIPTRPGNAQTRKTEPLRQRLKLYEKAFVDKEGNSHLEWVPEQRWHLVDPRAANFDGFHVYDQDMTFIRGPKPGFFAPQKELEWTLGLLSHELYHRLARANNMDAKAELKRLKPVMDALKADDPDLYQKISGKIIAVTALLAVNRQSGYNSSEVAPEIFARIAGQLEGPDFAVMNITDKELGPQIRNRIEEIAIMIASKVSAKKLPQTQKALKDYFELLHHPAAQKISGSRLASTASNIADRVLWIAVKMIDDANTEKGRIKVGGHQAASASAVHLMTALELFARRGYDHIAHKPHAAPVYHALQYLLGYLPESALGRFRENSVDPEPLTVPAELKSKISDTDFQRFTSLLSGLEASLPESAKTNLDAQGIHSYPGMADKDHVTIPTGSVGLGPAAVIGLGITQKWLKANGFKVPDSRYFAVVGDGEMSEGNLLEMLPLAGEYHLDNVVHLVDFNRLSLDGVMAEGTFDWIKAQYAAAGWRVIELKWGHRILEAFNRQDDRAGAEAFYVVMRTVSQKDYELLTGKSGAEIRAYILGQRPDLEKFLSVYSDEALYSIFTDLGGHDIQTILDALKEAVNPRAPGDKNKPTVIIAYTHKGYGIPSLMGNPSNHSLLLKPDQLQTLRSNLSVPQGDDFPVFDKDSEEGRLLTEVRQRLDAERTAEDNFKKQNGRVNVSGLPGRIEPAARRAVVEKNLSTQVYFSQIIGMMNRIAALSRETLTPQEKTLSAVAARYVTVSPDVATSTVYLSGMPSSVGGETLSGQRHFKVGIAEMNAVTLAAALGKSGDFFGASLLPVVSIYDMFLFRRAFDPVFYAQYWNSRLLLVGEPSGSSLSPEGAQHQSSAEPLISRALPNLITWEPAYPAELSYIEADRVKRVFQNDDEDRGVVYYRLSTLPIDQSGLLKNLSGQAAYAGLTQDRIMEKWGQDVLAGGYRLVDYRGSEGYKPQENVVNILASGAMVQEALIASEHLKHKGIFANVIVISSVDLVLGKLAKKSGYAQLQKLIPQEERAFTPLVTVADASPSSISGAAAILGLGLGEKNLGIERHGRSTRQPERLYRHHGIDRGSIAKAAFTMLMERDYGKGPAGHFIDAFSDGARLSPANRKTVAVLQEELLNLRKGTPEKALEYVRGLKRLLEDGQLSRDVQDFIHENPLLEQWIGHDNNELADLWMEISRLVQDMRWDAIYTQNTQSFIEQFTALLVNRYKRTVLHQNVPELEWHETVLADHKYMEAALDYLWKKSGETITEEDVPNIMAVLIMKLFNLAFAFPLPANDASMIGELEAKKILMRAHKELNGARLAKNDRKQAEIKKWIDQLHEEDPAVSVAAAEMLVAAGVQAVPDLIQALKDTEWKVRDLAADILGKIGPGASVSAPQLVELLSDPAKEVRLSAILALGNIGAATPSVIPALTHLLNSTEPNVQDFAASAIGRIGPKASAVVPLLAEIMESSQDKEAKRSAVMALGKMGPKAVPVLARGLENPDWNIRWNAAISLASSGSKAYKAVPALIKALQDPDWHVRFSAARTLGLIGPKARRAVPALKKATSDTKGFVRLNAEIALKNILGARLSARSKMFNELESFFIKHRFSWRTAMDGTIFDNTPTPVIQAIFEELERRYGALDGRQYLSFGAGPALKDSLAANFVYGMNVTAAEKDPLLSGEAEETLRAAQSSEIAGRNGKAFQFLPDTDAFDVSWKDADFVYFFYTQSNSNPIPYRENFEKRLTRKIFEMKPGAVLAFLFTDTQLMLGQDRYEALEKIQTDTVQLSPRLYLNLYQVPVSGARLAKGPAQDPMDFHGRIVSLIDEIQNGSSLSARDTDQSMMYLKLASESDAANLARMYEQVNSAYKIFPDMVAYPSARKLREKLGKLKNDLSVAKNKAAGPDAAAERRKALNRWDETGKKRGRQDGARLAAAEDSREPVRDWIRKIIGEYQEVLSSNEHGTAISVLGSARIHFDPGVYPGSSYFFEQAVLLGAEAARRKIPMRTGAGLALMEAPFLGMQSVDPSVDRQGIRIKLPFEAQTTQLAHNVHPFDLFLTRKFALLQNIYGTVSMPGGIGTIDETLQAWRMGWPMVAYGSEFWGIVLPLLYRAWRNTRVMNQVHRRGAAPFMTDDPAAALDYIMNTQRIGMPFRADAYHLHDVELDLTRALPQLWDMERAVTFVGRPKRRQDLHKARKIAEGLNGRVPVRVASRGRLFEAVRSGLSPEQRERLQAVLYVPRHREFTQEEKNFKDRLVFVHDESLHQFLTTSNSYAFVFFPGGVGTVDKLFDIIQIMQTDKGPRKPIIVVGEDFGGPIKAMLRSMMNREGWVDLISPGDEDLIQVVDTPEEALRLLTPVLPATAGARLAFTTETEKELKHLVRLLSGSIRIIEEQIMLDEEAPSTKSILLRSYLRTIKFIQKDLDDLIETRSTDTKEIVSIKNELSNIADQFDDLREKRKDIPVKIFRELGTTFIYAKRTLENTLNDAKTRKIVQILNVLETTEFDPGLLRQMEKMLKEYTFEEINKIDASVSALSKKWAESEKKNYNREQKLFGFLTGVVAMENLLLSLENFEHSMTLGEEYHFLNSYVHVLNQRIHLHEMTDEYNFGEIKKYRTRSQAPAEWAALERELRHAALLLVLVRERANRRLGHDGSRLARDRYDREIKPARITFMRIFEGFGFAPFTMQEYSARYPEKHEATTKGHFYNLEKLGLLTREKVPGNRSQNLWRLASFSPSRAAAVEFVLSEFAKNSDEETVIESLKAVLDEKNPALFTLPDMKWDFDKKDRWYKNKYPGMAQTNLFLTFQFLTTYFKNAWVKIPRILELTDGISPGGFDHQFKLLEELGLTQSRPGAWARLVPLSKQQVREINAELQAFASYQDLIALKSKIDTILEEGKKEREAEAVQAPDVYSLFPDKSREKMGRIEITLESVLRAVDAAGDKLKAAGKAEKPRLRDVADALGLPKHTGLNTFARVNHVELRMLGIWGLSFEWKADKFREEVNKAIDRLRGADAEFQEMPLLIQDLAVELRLMTAAELYKKASVLLGPDYLPSRGVFRPTDASKARRMQAMRFIRSIGLEPDDASIRYVARSGRQSLAQIKIQPEDRDRIIRVRERWKSDVAARRAAERFQYVERLIQTAVSQYQQALNKGKLMTAKRYAYKLRVLAPGHPALILTEKQKAKKALDQKKKVRLAYARRVSEKKKAYGSAATSVKEIDATLRYLRTALTRHDDTMEPALKDKLTGASGALEKSLKIAQKAVSLIDDELKKYQRSSSYALRYARVADNQRKAAGKITESLRKKLKVLDENYEKAAQKSKKIEPAYRPMDLQTRVGILDENIRQDMDHKLEPVRNKLKAMRARLSQTPPGQKYDELSAEIDALQEIYTHNLRIFLGQMDEAREAVRKDSSGARLAAGGKFKYTLPKEAASSAAPDARVERLLQALHSPLKLDYLRAEQALIQLGDVITPYLIRAYIDDFNSRGAHPILNYHFEQRLIEIIGEVHPQGAYAREFLNQVVAQTPSELVRLTAKQVLQKEELLNLMRGKQALPVDLNAAVRTNFILFDVGQLLLTQMNDHLKETKMEIFKAAGLSADALANNDFQEALDKLLSAPPNKNQMQRGKGAYQFKNWLNDVNALVQKYYPAAVELNESQFADAVYGVKKPSIDLQRVAREVVRAKAALGFKVGAFANLEAQSRPYLEKKLNEYYPGLIDRGFIFISGEMGSLKPNDEDYFPGLLKAYKALTGTEPKNVVLADNHFTSFKPALEYAGVRYFLHIGFAGANKRPNWTAYSGKRIRDAKLFGSGNEPAFFDALVRYAGSSRASSGARLAGNPAVSFLTNVYRATRRTGRIAVADSLYTLQTDKNESLLIYFRNEPLAVLSKEHYSVRTETAAGQAVSSVSVSMTDFKSLMEKTAGRVDALVTDGADNSKKVVSILDLNSIGFRLKSFEQVILPLLTEELKQARRKEWGKNIRFVPEGSDEDKDNFLKLIYSQYPELKDYVAKDASGLEPGYESAPHIALTSRMLVLPQTRYFFFKALQDGDIPNFRAMFKLSATLARIDKLETNDPALREILGALSVFLNQDVNAGEYILLVQGLDLRALVKYALPPVLHLEIEKAIQAARLAAKMIAQAA